MHVNINRKNDFVAKVWSENVTLFIYVPTSDNFSFQNNWIKKCTCWKTKVFWENNGFFWGKQCFFFKSNIFDTTSHMIYFDYKAYAFYQNKYYSCFLFITQSLIEVTVL